MLHILFFQIRSHNYNIDCPNTSVCMLTIVLSVYIHKLLISFSILTGVPIGRLNNAILLLLLIFRSKLPLMDALQSSMEPSFSESLSTLNV